MIPTVHGWGSLLSLATSPLLRECSAISVVEIAEPNSFVLAEDSRAEFFRGGSPLLRECSAVSVIEIAEPNSFVLAEDSSAEFFRGGSSALSSRKNLGYAYVTDNRLCFFSFILVSFYCIMDDFGSSSSGKANALHLPGVV